MQTTLQPTDYIGQQAQLIAIRYLAEKEQQRINRQQSMYFYGLAGVIVASYIGLMTFVFG